MANALKASVGRIETTRSKRVTWSLVSAVFLTGVIATISFSYLAANLDSAARWRRADGVLGHHATVLRTAIERTGRLEHATTSFFAASLEVEPEEFSVFARSLLRHYQDVQAVLWVPLVAPAFRAEHLRMAAARGLEGYAVRGPGGEPIDDNRLVFPTWFIAGQTDSNEISPGLDWGSIPPARRAMDLARDSGDVIASGPLTPWLERQNRPLTVLVAPIYDKSLPVGSPEERRIAILGFVLALEWPESLLHYVAGLESSVAGDAGGLSLLLLDITDPAAPQLLAQYPASATRPNFAALNASSLARANHSADITVAGREWRLIGIETKSDTGWSLAVLSSAIGGSLVSLLLALLVWLVVGRIGRGEAARLQAISDNATDGIITADDRGNITSFNPAAASMFGRRPEDIVGGPLTSLMPERLRERHSRGFARYLATGKAKIVGKGPVEFTALRADGTEFPIELALGTWSGASGAPSFSAVVRDNTARRQMERELVAAKDLAEAASLTKSVFLAKMSHELRTPLNAIVGLSDLLGDTQLTPSQRADLQQISRSADSLLRLVSDILDLSRIEAGQLELASEPLSLRSIVEDSVMPLSRRAQVKGLEMAWRVAPEVPDALVGDAGRLQQILINLVGNAVKFTNSGKVEVEVTCSGTREQRVELAFLVRDTGPGIPLEQREKIFELFVQGGRHGEGVGLGLATATQLVQMMGGRLWVESEPGEGSTFHFTVDLGLNTEATPVEPAPRQLEGIRILIVDDNPLSRQSLAEIAESWGMIAGAVGDGIAGVEELRSAAAQGTPFELLLIDIDLPDTSGIDLARTVATDASLPSVPMILMCSKPDGEAQAKATAAGFFDRLEKPVSRSKLLESIERALGIASPPTARRVAAQPAASPMRILLAEDNPINQAVTQRMLTRLGHEVTSVNDGLAAVERFAREHFDVVLMDYDMPVMDGLEAATRIRDRERELGGHVPMIALTAYAMAEDRERLLRAGIDDVLTKPIRIDLLANTLEALPRGGAPLPASSAHERRAKPPLPTPSFTTSKATAGTPLEQGTILDIDRLAEQGGSDMIFDLIEMLEKQLPELEEQIAAAITDKDANRLRLASHTLKGSLALFGAERASEAARRLEELGRSASLEGATQALAELRAHDVDLRGVLASVKEKFVVKQGESPTQGAPASH